MKGDERESREYESQRENFKQFLFNDNIFTKKICNEGLFQMTGKKDAATKREKNHERHSPEDKMKEGMQCKLHHLKERRKDTKKVHQTVEGCDANAVMQQCAEDKNNKIWNI